LISECNKNKADRPQAVKLPRRVDFPQNLDNQTLLLIENVFR